MSSAPTETASSSRPLRHTDAKTLEQQAEEFSPAFVALESETRAPSRFARREDQRPGAAATLAEVPADVVLNGISGFAGLAATVGALKTGNTVALANKSPSSPAVSG